MNSTTNAPHDGVVTAAPTASLLPAQTTLRRVQLQVADLERSLAFYQQVLGMRMLGRTQRTCRWWNCISTEPLRIRSASSSSHPIEP